MNLGFAWSQLGDFEKAKKAFEDARRDAGDTGKFACL